jgi:hypothetical protein
MTTTTTQSVLITGNTYPVKDSLRSLGGHWDPQAKGWRVPSTREAQARALVSGAPSSTYTRRPAHPSSGSGSGTCRACHRTIRDAPHHRAMGGLCGECAFDEYDC